MRYALALGGVLETLKTYPDNTFHGLFCDPPYGFKFMNKKWDYDVPSVEIWQECLRVLRPGGLLLSFGGPRTFHRLACGIEDAGFELRDCLMWLFGKGFPKSQNISLAIDNAAGAERQVVGTRVLTGNAAISTKDKGGTYGVQVGSATKEVQVTAPATELAQEWDGYGTALKPAYEPVILARKPLDGTMAENIAKWGCGGLAIDACRVGDEGRWPANLILDEEAGALLDATVGSSPSTLTGRADPKRKHKNPSDKEGKSWFGGGASSVYADSGGPSRFFYCPKVSTKERELGCESLPLKSAGECTEREDGSAGLNNPRAGAGRGGGARNHHPTLKPIALTEYLAKLILPPSGGVLLVPFSGSGSEIIGALKAGWPAVMGIERESEYVEIAKCRIPANCQGALLVG